MKRKAAEMLVTAGIAVATLTGTATAQNSPGSAAIDASPARRGRAQGRAGRGALVTDRDRVLYQGAFGVADVATGRPLTSDALFRIASMTKPVTSVAMMQLVEQGRIGLDDPGRKIPAGACGTEGHRILRRQDRRLQGPSGIATADGQAFPDAHVRIGLSASPARSGAISSRAPARPIRSAARCCSILASAGTTAPAPMSSASWSRWCPARSSRIISASTSLSRSR